MTNYKRKTAEELKAEMNELTETLHNGVKDYLESDRYREILNNISKFHNYSVNNCILIALQKPEASYVSSYTDWNKKFNRQVKQGEKGIAIYAPVQYTTKELVNKVDPITKQPIMNDKGEIEKEERVVKRTGFRITKTFDISQTEQIPFKPVVEINPTKELTGNVEDYETLRKAIELFSPVPVEYSIINGSAKGYYSDSEQKIVIKEDMSEQMTVKTLLHETTHSIINNSQLTEIKQQLGIELSEEQSRQQSETIAESCAFLVAKHFGIDTSDYSFPYVASWAQEPELVLKSLEVVKATANKMIEEIENQLELLYQQQYPVVYGYVYNEQGLYENKDYLVGSAENIANYIMTNEGSRVVITDEQDRLLVSTMEGPGGFIDRVSDANLRNELLEKILPLQYGEKEVGEVKYVKGYEDSITAEELAIQLTEYALEENHYDYMDNESYPGETYDNTLSELRKGKVNSFIDYLKESIENTEILELNKKAQELIEGLQEYSNNYEQQTITNKHSMRM